MKKPFLLILSTSGGAGHTRAAEALLQAARASQFPLRAEHYDCLDFTSKTFKYVYANSYLAMVNYLPELWGYLYTEAEQKPYSKRGLVRVFDHINYQKYLRALRELDPDAIVCTHFLPYISISDQILQTDIRAPILAATTDFDVHQLWVDKIVSQYYVFHEESAWQLNAKGIAKEKISVTGIPVGPGFTRKSEKNVARQHLEIPTNRFTLLVLSGGFGVGHVKQIAEAVLDLLASYPARSFNVLIVCGKNERIRLELEKQKYPANIHASIYGYVNNIDELMDASDILVSKSGGLTSAEAMAKHLPMMIVDPIPGQESRNATMIVERGAGRLAIDHHNLKYKLKLVLEDPALLRDLQDSAEALGRPRAAEDIVNDVCRRFIKQQ